MRSKKPLLILGTLIFFLALLVILGIPSLQKFIRSRSILVSYSTQSEIWAELFTNSETYLKGKELNTKSIKIIPPYTDDTDLVLELIDRTVPPKDVFAYDPYLLYYDTRQVTEDFWEEGVDLPSLMNILVTSVENSDIPLLIAGQLDDDLSAFVLYLAHALLDEEAYEALSVELSQDRDDLPEGLLEITKYIQSLVEKGVIPANWTNWDRLALIHALEEGSGSVYFLPRSVRKTMTHQQAFFLSSARPPEGPGRLRYTLVGSGVSVELGPGPNAEERVALRELLQGDEFQRSIEENTPASPIRAVQPYINKDHRDTADWIRNASVLHSIALLSTKPRLIAALRLALR